MPSLLTVDELLMKVMWVVANRALVIYSTNAWNGLKEWESCISAALLNICYYILYYKFQGNLLLKKTKSLINAWCSQIQWAITLSKVQHCAAKSTATSKSVQVGMDALEWMLGHHLKLNLDEILSKDQSSDPLM